MTTQNLKLDLNPGGAPKVVRVSQYDNDSRNLLINLVNGDKGAFTIPAGVAVSVNGTKPSGKGFSDACTISSNQVTVVIKDTMTDEPGRVRCELVLTKDSARLGSAKFELDVDRGALDPEAIIESDNFDNIIKDAVRECAEEKLIELTVDQELSNESSNPVANKVVSNLFASALKGMVYGSEVTADDISPVKHNLRARAHGKNLFPIPYSDKGSEINGITYTVNADGSITAKGTAESTAALYITRGLPGIKGTVFLSGCPAGGSISASSGGGFSLRLNKIVNGTEVSGGADVGNGAKITLNGERIRVYIVVLGGVSVDCTFYPMLTYGSAPTDYEAAVDPTTLTVTAGGKAFTPDSSGNVEGLTSDMLASGISVNNNGIVDCEYNRDLTKAIARIEAALFN